MCRHEHSVMLVSGLPDLTGTAKPSVNYRHVSSSDVAMLLVNVMHQEQDRAQNLVGYPHAQA